MSDTGTRYYARGLSITSAVSLWEGEVGALFCFYEPFNRALLKTPGCKKVAWPKMLWI